MKLERPERRQSPETIIALIDVVFFLLIFFMLIGRMDATAPFDVLPAVASTGTDMPGGGATVSISVDGKMALNGAGAEIGGVLDGLTKALKQDPSLLVRINAHKDTELRFVLPLVAQIEALGAQDVELVVTPASP